MIATQADEPPEYDLPDEVDEDGNPRWWMEAIASGTYDWEGEEYDPHRHQR